MKAAVGSANEDLPTEYSSVLLITHSALSNKVRVRSNKVVQFKLYRLRFAHRNRLSAAIAERVTSAILFLQSLVCPHQNQQES